MAVKILLTIHAEPGRADEVSHTLRNMREVTFASTTYGGPYDVMAIVEVKNLERYRSFALDVIGRIAGIDDYVSFIAAGPAHS
ncbi:MAG: Lrp/AsnC ligand binding domain-containing protein [Candidatus Thorarchaeota archaeon]|nr:Lrp/AsnC ligand binding domain-containing protein [Candidatus Thorarchaeota archaeon]